MTEVASTVTPRNFLPPGKKAVRVVVNTLVKILTDIVCKVYDEELKKVPLTGPMILIINHINFLELPILYPRIHTDLGTGFSKEENWDSPLYRLLFNIWDVIPINREEVDLSAIRQGLEALEQGRILFITPEGTRSHHGRLQEGKPGVAFIAQHSGAPVVPVACYGGEKFNENLKHLRRTEFHIAVGNPFYVDTGDIRVTRKVRREITDEMMYQIAALLPPPYRGIYADLDHATETHLHFESLEESALRQAQPALPPSEES